MFLPNGSIPCAVVPFPMRFAPWLMELSLGTPLLITCLVPLPLMFILLLLAVKPHQLWVPCAVVSARLGMLVPWLMALSCLALLTPLLVPLLAAPMLWALPELSVPTAVVPTE